VHRGRSLRDWMTCFRSLLSGKEVDKTSSCQFFAHFVRCGVYAGDSMAVVCQWLRVYWECFVNCRFVTASFTNTAIPPTAQKIRDFSNAAYMSKLQRRAE
jgi:hypothetical protein